MRELAYPKSHAYTELFEDVRHFILQENEKGTSVNYHWSRWEWMFARLSFEDEVLEYDVMFYEEDTLVGVLMVEDVSGIYYYVTSNKEVKNRIVKHTIKRGFQLMVEEQDKEMIELLKENGFTPTDYQEHMLRLTTSLQSVVPDGFIVQTLDENYDVKEHHKCLWEGFNHGPEVPFTNEHLIYRERQVSSPHFNRRYASVAGKDHSYLSFASIWYEQGTTIALIEPVATIPSARKKGLAASTIARCVQEAKKDGAKEIYVGSNQKFYYDLGFELLMTSTVWNKNDET